MNSIDDITLVAYVDGELDPATCAEVETLLADSEALRQKVRGLRESTALVRHHARIRRQPSARCPPVSRSRSRSRRRPGR